MTISTREQAIYAKIESTPGTYDAPAGSDAIEVANLKVNPAENLRWIERPIIRASLNPQQGLYGGALMGFEFDVELKGSGTAGTAPRWGRLALGCGMQETVVAVTSVTYTPESTLTDHESLSIGYRAGGVYRTAKGCRGTVSLRMAAGEPAMLSFKLVGHINSEADASAPTATYETTRPPPFVGATFTIGSFASAIAELSIDLQNNVAISPDPNGTDGYGEVRVTARNTSGKVNPEAKLIATKDWIGIFRANTTQAIATGVIGGTAGNRWAVSAPAAYIRNPPFGERDELLTHELELGFSESSGDDEIAIALT